MKRIKVTLEIEGGIDIDTEIAASIIQQSIANIDGVELVSIVAIERELTA